MATLRAFTSTQSASLSFSCAKPTGTAPGDILVAFQTAHSFNASSMTTPTGGGASWQLLGALSRDWAGTKVWWKIAGAGEPASYGFTQDVNAFTGLADSIVGIVAISDHGGATPLIASLSNGDDNTITCPSVSPGTDTGVTLRWAAGTTGLDGLWGIPAGNTKLFDRYGANGRAKAALAYKNRGFPGAVGSANFAWSAAGTMPSHGITVDVGGTAVPPEPPPDPIPPSKDIHYKFVFNDLRTDNHITTLDLDDVTYTRAIGEPGSFSASIAVVNREIADEVAKVVPRWVDDPTEPDSLSTGPGRTVCHVYRNGVVWGTYVIWKATVNIDGRGAIKVQLTGASLESYLNAVEIRDDLSYTGTDQLDIARALITEMQALTYANIGLTLQTGTSGVNRDRTYLAGETATFGQRLRELADVNGGFEWLIHTADPGTGTRVREVRFGYPKLGTQTDHVFSQPGNVLSVSQEIDALRAATSYRARGESVSTDASTSSQPLMSAEQNATAYLAAGWPRIDRTMDYSTVKETSTLNAYAARWAAERPGTVRVHQVSVKLDETEWTPTNLGDYARVMLVNDWWPIRNGGASFNHRWRVIGVSVRATSRNSQETATLVFEEEVDI
ncbi:hypothetical protein [Nonomuraea pusilla]|uniref:Minor tail protein n=1 Tax=Nonomuraea pusilla TaxID=46177 RepID=A0A1H8K4K3_9ACTN|nr:hypothetical protein [Nonomuraea pusilla]SEN87617.1 hypothetical protein SAMN05660976_08518 [Nonomuraea pusilla]